MIIELKDIPNNRKIKHISFDIDFDDFCDDSSITIKTDDNSVTKHFPKEKTGEIKTESEKITKKVSLDRFEETKIEPEKTVALPDVNIEEREVKEIPHEMQDLEF